MYMYMYIVYTCNPHVQAHTHVQYMYVYDHFTCTMYTCRYTPTLIVCIYSVQCTCTLVPAHMYVHVCIQCTCMCTFENLSLGSLDVMMGSILVLFRKVTSGI